MDACPERPRNRDVEDKMQDKGKKTFNFKRLVVAAVLVPVLIAYIYLLPPFPYFLGLLLVIGMMAMHEFYTMYSVPKRLHIPSILFGGLLLYIVCLYPSRVPETLFGGLVVLLVLRLFTAGSPRGSMKEIGPLCVGFLYIGTFLSFQWFLRDDIAGRQYIFFLYTSVWLADSAAYYIGSYLGKNKLCPAVSPNKTIEGAIGSILGGATGGLIINTIFEMPDITVVKATIIGGILGIVTVAGDLVESMFKRDAGVKDSSRFIPGHGGLLDKLDGLLLAGPVLYLILRRF